MADRLITPSQLSLFSRSPVIGAWWIDSMIRDVQPLSPHIGDQKALAITHEGDAETERRREDVCMNTR